MDPNLHLNSKLERNFEQMNQLIQKQSKLFKEIKSTIIEIDTHILPLQMTVGKLITYGLSKDEILDITRISSNQYEELISTRKYCQIPYIYLSETEKVEFDLLIQAIQKSTNIYELIDSSKEGERIIFIKKVLDRYLREYRDIQVQEGADVYTTFIEKTIINGNAKSVYSALVRIFGNEIKLKREEILISSYSH